MLVATCTNLASASIPTSVYLASTNLLELSNSRRVDPRIGDAEKKKKFPQRLWQGSLVVKPH